MDIVLAEYGLSGVNVMEVCQEANIPLIQHFHGCDAYDHSFLESVGRHYSALFENAAAIIVVSHDMKHQLLLLGAPEEKLYYNPCGVDVSLFQSADPAHAPPGHARAPARRVRLLLDRSPRHGLAVVGVDPPGLRGCRVGLGHLALSGLAGATDAARHPQPDAVAPDQTSALA